MLNWSIDDVIGYVHSLQLKNNYAELFKQQGVDGTVLTNYLDDVTSWKELGVTDQDDINCLLQNRSKLLKNENHNHNK